MNSKLLALLWLSCFALAVPRRGLYEPPNTRPACNGARSAAAGSPSFSPPHALRGSRSGAGRRRMRCTKSWPTSGARRSLGRTRIVLDDSTDQANGFATFFPFNLVGVNLAEPPPDSELAASRGWLDLVLAHELTHLFTLNAATDLGRALRRVFGTLPLLYSAAQMPPWVIEGLAVYGESRFSRTAA